MSRLCFFDIVALFIIFLLSSVVFGGLYYYFGNPWIALGWVVTNAILLYGYLLLTDLPVPDLRFIRPGIDVDERGWHPLGRKKK